MTVNVKVCCDTTGVKAVSHMGHNWLQGVGSTTPVYIPPASNTNSSQCSLFQLRGEFNVKKDTSVRFMIAWLRETQKGKWLVLGNCARAAVHGENNEVAKQRKWRVGVYQFIKTKCQHPLTKTGMWQDEKQMWWQSEGSRRRKRRRRRRAAGFHEQNTPQTCKQTLIHWFSWFIVCFNHEFVLYTQQR